MNLSSFFRLCSVFTVVRLCSVFTVVLSGTSATFAIDILVPLEVPGIQQAIDLAENGDVIIVSAGTWNEAIDFSGKSIEIRSESGPEVTTIEGSLDGPVVTLESGETNQALLQGFTIKGGGGVDIAGSRFGGGVYIQGSFPRIRQCLIESNQASIGGGIFVGGAPSELVLFEEVELRSNLATDSGGALALIEVPAGISLIDCDIQENHANTVSGAIYCELSSLQMESTTVRLNSSDMLVGAVWLYQSSDGNFVDCQFSENSSSLVGGALVVSDFSRVTVADCVFHENSGGASGGALLFDVGNDQLLQEVRSCVFFGNVASGSGAHLAVSFNLVNLLVEQCTFGLPGPGSSSSIRINNEYPESIFFDSCIVRGGPLPSIEAESGSVLASYSCIEGLTTSGVDALDCIDEDPLFVDATNGNLNLLSGSPCIDNGNPALPLDSDGSAPDMGALGLAEAGPFRRGDVDADGTTNLADAIQILGTLFIQGSDPLGCIDAGDCNDDGLLNISDAVTLLEALFVSGNPLPAPVGDCGADPTADALECGNFCN
ncbi:MAG: right-handed parallel beta-helix repeat-containing protein [Planctomycetota bacterium]